MLHKTRGIVLSFIKYKESSIIVRIFTEEFGLRSYLVNGVRKKNKGNKLVFYQNLSLVEMVVYENPKKDINRISEIKFFHQPISIPFDVKKGAIGIFLCEFLEKMIIDPDPDKILFEYLTEKLIEFDVQKDGFENFHLKMLITLTKMQGIGMELGTHALEGVETELSHEFILESIMLLSEGNPISLNGKTRSELLLFLIQYFQKHLGIVSNIKSLDVLSTVLS